MRTILIIVESILLFLSSAYIRETREVISYYKKYYKASESLLDSLDAQYSWTDSYDVFDYYESKQKIVDHE
jgi:hypothetical protein